MRELITSVLDIAGLLLLVAAVAVFVWPFSTPGSVAAGGLGLLAVSWIIDRPQGVKREPAAKD